MRVTEKCVISDCGKYRYWLKRTIPAYEVKPIVFIMLNPSTADGETDDPTIRRCIDFATRWGGSELIVVNLFAYRATDPSVLKEDATIDPVGELNDNAIALAVDYALSSNGIVVAAWGEHGKFMDRAETVLGQLGNLPVYCLKKNKSGSPAHPLYQKRDTVLEIYNGTS